MQTAQKLKNEIQLNTELTELLDILKGIASSEFRALEKRKERFAKFINAFEGFFQMIDFSSMMHPFAQDKLNKLGIIMITSDEGFMGGLNTRVISTALDYPQADNATLIIVGERGAGYLKGLNRKFVDFPGITVEDRYEAALRLKDYIMKEGMAGNFSRLIIVYPRPISFTVQQVEVLTVLPCSELFKKHADVSQIQKDIILESSLGSIIEYLLGVWITYKLFEVFEDSKLSEFSARTVHLEESHQLLLDKDKKIRLQYFRSHHEMIDRGTRETFSAQAVGKKKRVE